MGYKLTSAEETQRSRERRERYKAEGRASLGGRRAGLRFIVELRKAVPCADCGGSFPSCAMDFDHLPGKPKVAAVTTLANVAQTQASALFAEMDVCEPVCANCHRVRTVVRAGNL